jgi:hypothetical protein
MFKLKNIWPAIFLIAGSFSVFGQTDIDIIRYSFTNPTATARATALGGAVGAMGTDATVLSTNPGGLGITRSSQFMITPMVGAATTRATHFGNTEQDFRGNFSLGNFSYISSQRTENDKGVVRVNYGVSLNRLASFQRDYTVQGVIPGLQNSYTNRFLDFADGVPEPQLDGFVGGLVFDAFIIDTIPGQNNEYEALFEDVPLNQQQRIKERGSISDISFGAALNINERLFLGASVGIVSLRFEEEKTIEESLVNVNNATNLFPMISYDFTENFSARGSAINLKLGGVVKVNDYLRLGAAWHSGTVYEISENYSTNARAVFFDGAGARERSAPGAFNYRVRVPGRLIGSATVIFGKKGLLNFEYERVNYQNGELRPSRLEPGNTGAFTEPNAVMGEFYRPGNIFRAGAEVKVYGPIAVRAGYVLMETMVQPNFRTFEQDRQIFSGGVGMNLEKWSFDFTYFRTIAQTDYFMYALDIPPTQLETVFNGFMFSLGYRIGR